VLASIGFAFDIYELLMLPLIVRPALLELIGARPGSPEFNLWVGWLFFLPALCGGVFGLLGGYLTDRLGRRRVLTWSIMVYAISAFLAGFSTSVEMLLVLRCTTFVGVCVEFVAAVAWLAELFDDPRQRERVLGYTQAFSSLGGLLVAVANGLAVAWAADLPAIGMPGVLEGRLGSIDAAHAHEPWRYTLMSGLLPALPLLLVRPFLPESPRWRERKTAGTLRRPSIAALFSPALRRTTVVTTILFACSYGVAFGAIQHVPRIVPGLPEVVARQEGLPVPAQRALEQEVAADVTKVQEIGGLVGRLLLAVLIVRIVSRRRLLRVFQWPSLVFVPVVFAVIATTSLPWLYPGMFLVGVVTVAQFSFWGNYLPRVYPLHLRGTGESFAANVGGRMIGTSFAWVTTTLASQEFVPGAAGPERLAFAAALVGTFVVVVGLCCSLFLPEPRSETLPE
jgi:MFS family permease